MAMNVNGGPATRAGADLRRNGRLGGFLLMGGALATMPASLLLEPQPPAAIYLLTALGAISGLACLRIPWDRLPPASMNVLAAVGTLEIALVCAEVDTTYRLLFGVVAVYAAMVLPTRAELAAQLTLIGGALLLSALYEPELAREHVRIALLEMPSLVIAAGAVRYLRETLERREQANREFAREAVALAIRIRGPASADGERLDELARALEAEEPR